MSGSSLVVTLNALRLTRGVKVDANKTTRTSAPLSGPTLSTGITT